MGAFEIQLLAAAAAWYGLLVWGVMLLVGPSGGAGPVACYRARKARRRAEAAWAAYCGAVRASYGGGWEACEAANDAFRAYTAAARAARDADWRALTGR